MLGIGWAMLLVECTIFIWRTCEAGTFSNLRQGRRANNSSALPLARQLLIVLQSVSFLDSCLLITREPYIYSIAIMTIYFLFFQIFMPRPVFLCERDPLQGQCHEIFCFWFFSWISLPPAQSIRLGPFGILRKFGEIFISQGAPLVSTTLAENLPPVSMTPVANNWNKIRLLRP
jgi:hypothetical protein